MYPAARFAVIVLWLVALLLLAGAVYASLVSLEVIKPEAIPPEIQNQIPEKIEAKAFFSLIAINFLIAGLFILIWCDMVRAVVNTAINTKELIRLMREERKAALRR
jgi:hypothetical protein